MKEKFPPFNETQKDILIGTMLGDSSLQTYTAGISWRVRFIQGEAHKDYLFHLYDVFKDYVGTPPRESDDGKGHKRWSFNTLVVPELKEIADLFYIRAGGKWVKTPKPFVLNDPVGLNAARLAYWFMDDGSLKTAGLTTEAFIICTDGFRLNEIKMLGGLFKTQYNIYVSYHKKDNGYRIYIPTKYKKQFATLIKPYVREDMLYKLPVAERGD